MCICQDKQGIDQNAVTVNIVGSPSNGLANKAPSSVICVNLLRDTNWNPPLSYESKMTVNWKVIMTQSYMRMGFIR